MNRRQDKFVLLRSALLCSSRFGGGCVGFHQFLFAPSPLISGIRKCFRLWIEAFFGSGVSARGLAVMSKTGKMILFQTYPFRSMPIFELDTNKSSVCSESFNLWKQKCKALIKIRIRIFIVFFFLANQAEYSVNYASQRHFPMHTPLPKLIALNKSRSVLHHISHWVVDAGDSPRFCAESLFKRLFGGIAKRRN